MVRPLRDTDIARVRAEHSIVDTLGRVGINPPARWDGAADYMISCPCPAHADSTPSCIVHPRTDRWHCFGCGARSDMLELIRQVERVTSHRGDPRQRPPATPNTHSRERHPARRATIR